MKTNNSIVGVFADHNLVEHAIKELDANGVDISKLSIVGKDYQSTENLIGYYNTGDRVRYWGSFGAFWGSIWGLLTGAAFMWVPPIGPIVVAGPFVAALVGAAEGALIGGGLSAVGAALFSMGIPKNSVLKYEEVLKAGKFLLVFQGTDEQRDKVEEILEMYQVLELDDAPQEKAAV